MAVQKFTRYLDKAEEPVRIVHGWSEHQTGAELDVIDFTTDGKRMRLILRSPEGGGSERELEEVVGELPWLIGEARRVRSAGATRRTW